MALSDIALCSRALIKLGARPIANFTEGSAESEIASLLYAPTRDALLASNAWSFATLQANLTRAVTAPLADYLYSYILPTDVLRILSTGSNGVGAGNNFRVYRDVLHSNAETVTLTYITRPPETICPAYFDTALMARLSAEFCLPLTENTARADLLYRLADTEIARARQIDAQQDTPNRLQDFSLITSRF